MKRIVSVLFLLGVAWLTPLALCAQQISYSQPQRNDYKNTEFEIIGRVGDNILVYTSYRNDYTISIYDNSMNLKQVVPMPFLPPGRVINVDFVAFPQKFLIIYQFQRRRWVYCYGAEMDADCQLNGQLQFIDSTDMGPDLVKTKLYSVVVSEDKSKIMVYKINQGRRNSNIFYTFLMDGDLRLINNSRVVLPMEDRKDYLSNFKLSNFGDFIFDKVESGTRVSLDNAWIIRKPADQDTMISQALDMQNKFLDQLRLKLDNQDNRVYIVSFYYNQRRGDVQGLYFGKYDWVTSSFDQQKFVAFGESLKENARTESTAKAAFDNYFLRQIILTGNGGMLMLAESYYTASSASPWDRWDYLYGPGSFYPSYYYSPFSPWYYDPNSWNNDYNVRYYYDNVAVFCYDPDGNMQWSNFVRKNQFDDNSDALLSYQLMNTGNSLHILFNAPFRRSFMLTDVKVSPDGSINQLPTLRDLDRGYQWMPKYGKQISSWQIVIPCIYRNYICFAKVDY